MKVLLIAALASVIGVGSVYAEVAPVVIGDVVMPTVESSAAFQKVEKKYSWKSFGQSLMDFMGNLQ